MSKANPTWKEHYNELAAAVLEFSKDGTVVAALKTNRQKLAFQKLRKAALITTVSDMRLAGAMV